MSTPVRPIVRRICKCGCGYAFAPPSSRPGQEYIFGHKPSISKNRTRAAATAPKVDKNDVERRRLDYRIALTSARNEIGEIERSIDQVDEELMHLRQELSTRDKQKETLTERHLNLSATATALEALVEGRSLVREVSAEAPDGSI